MSTSIDFILSAFKELVTYKNWKFEEDTNADLFVLICLIDKKKHEIVA